MRVKRKSVLRMGAVLLSAGFMMGTVSEKAGKGVRAEEAPVIEGREGA